MRCTRQCFLLFMKVQFSSFQPSHVACNITGHMTENIRITWLENSCNDFKRLREIPRVSSRILLGFFNDKHPYQVCSHPSSLYKTTLISKCKTPNSNKNILHIQAVHESPSLATSHRGPFCPTFSLHISATLLYLDERLRNTHKPGKLYRFAKSSCELTMRRART